MSNVIADPFVEDEEEHTPDNNVGYANPPVHDAYPANTDGLDDVDIEGPASETQPSAPSNHGARSGENIFPDLKVDAAPVKATTPGGILEITVSDPEKKGDSVLNAFVSYKVNTKTDAGNGKFRQSSVVRRYKDFLWLRNQLVAKNEGWLVPPMPEKAVLGRFSPMFVDSRRRGLELFLNRIAQHPALRDHEEVKIFLHGAGQDFSEVRQGKAGPAAEQGKSSSLWSSWTSVANAVQTVSNTWGAGKEREKSKDDITCESIETYADTMEQTVATVYKNITTHTTRTKEIANAWFDFGFSCTLLGQFETEQQETKLGNAFARLGNCADRLSVLITQKVDNQIVHFQEPFDDFLRQISAVKEMLKTRSGSLTQYHSALAALEAKQASLEKYRQRPGKEAKVQQLEREVQEAQASVETKLQELQTITERVFQETARFRQEKRVNFKNMMQDFVRMQIDNAKKMQAAWEGVLPGIESMPY